MKYMQNGGWEACCKAADLRIKEMGGNTNLDLSEIIRGYEQD
jgi:hypothetical protein